MEGDTEGAKRVSGLVYKLCGSLYERTRLYRRRRTGRK